MYNNYGYFAYRNRIIIKYNRVINLYQRHCVISGCTYFVNTRYNWLCTKHWKEYGEDKPPWVKALISMASSQERTERRIRVNEVYYKDLYKDKNGQIQLVPILKEKD